MAAILNSAILNLAILESAILVFPLKHTPTCQDWFPPFAQKKLHSLILTQLDDGDHLEFCHLEFFHVGFSFCIVEFRHLVFFSQIHSKTSPSTLTLTQTNSIWDSNSFILTQLDDGGHLEICHLGFSFWHLGFRHLVIFLSESLKTCTLPPLWLWLKTNSIWLKLIHSYSTWWWQPSWILPSWI